MRQPKLLAKIWAAMGLKNTIPESRNNQLPQSSATYDEGFPAITMTPIAQGGKAPSGKDMNGVLNELSAHIVHLNKGGLYKFDSAFAEKINGYDKGAILLNNTETAIFISLVDRNKTDFNTTNNYSQHWAKLADIESIKHTQPKDLDEHSQTAKDHTGHSHRLPLASLIKKGIVKLYSGLDSDSEEMAATPNAIKRLKALIDANIRRFEGFIPNSKKSDAVNSNSSDTVATSKAVSTANNNANARVAKSGDTMTGHLQINVNDWSSVRLFNRAGKHFIAEVRPDSAGGAFGTLIYRDDQDRDLARLALPQKNGTVALFEESVSKSGDAMTGNLEIDRADSYVLGKQGSTKRWFVGKGGANSNDVALYNYTYNYGLTLKADRVESSKPYYVGNNRVPHSGDAYLDLASGNYGGVRIDRVERGDVMLMESHDNQFAFIRRDRSSGQNISVAYIPSRGGVVLFNGDLVGAVCHFASTSPPTGWLKANGAAVSRTTYAELFAKIGTTYGAGDGRTTFNLPDLRGEFVRGLDDGRNVDAGRRLGSLQLGSAQALNSGNAMRSLGIGNQDNQHADIWQRSQHDKIVAGQQGYQEIYGSYSDIFDWHGRNSHGRVKNGNNQVEFGAVRPRNIALLACIKY